MAFKRTMVSMAKAPEEVQEEQEEMKPAPVPTPPKVPSYPYGLCLSLDEESLEKLGLGTPGVGDTLCFCAEAKVTSVSENERESADGENEKCCRVELQITDMVVEEDENDPRARSVKRRYTQPEE